MNELIEAIEEHVADVKHRCVIGGRCRGCDKPFGEWDTLHPLFRSWSGKCPGCHTETFGRLRPPNQEN
jgi:hypothetical protein